MGSIMGCRPKHNVIAPDEPNAANFSTLANKQSESWISDGSSKENKSNTQASYKSNEWSASEPSEPDNPASSHSGGGSFASLRRRISSFANRRNHRNAGTPKMMTASMERQVEKYSYPGPAPPIKTKAQICDRASLAAVDQRALTMPRSLLYGTFREITKYLTRPYKTDVQKVRALFIWVASQNMHKLQTCLHKLPCRNTPLECLFRIYWKMGDYSHFFAQLCRSAGLPCVLISGVSKCIGYHLGWKINRSSMGAHWNAVYCDGNWRLIDVLFAVSMVVGSRPNKWTSNHDERNENPDDENYCDLNQMQVGLHQVNESFFLTDPNVLIYTHLPDDPAWQLLENPITKEEFAQNAYLTKRFFRLNMQMLLPVPNSTDLTLVAENGCLVIQFSIPEERASGMEFRYALFRHRKAGTISNMPLERYVLYQKTRDSIKFHSRLPLKGRFKFSIYGREEEECPEFDLCASYLLENREKTKNVEPFPDCPKYGWGPTEDMARFGLMPKSHDEPIINTVDGKIEIRLSMQKRVSIVPNLKHNDLKDVFLQRNMKVKTLEDELIVTVRLQRKGDYALSLHVNYPNEPGELKNVCNYLLKCHKDTTQRIFPRIHHACTGRGLSADRLMVLPKPPHLGDQIITSTGKICTQFLTSELVPVELLCELQNNELQSSSLSENVVRTTEGGVHTFNFELPQRGEYALNIYARKLDDPCRVFHVYSYLIECTQAAHLIIPAAPTTESVMPHYMTGDIAVIRMQSELQRRTVEMLRKNSQHAEIPQQIQHKLVRDKDVYRIMMPDYGVYAFDVFDEHENGTLSRMAQHEINRHEPAPGEEEDVVEEGFEELTEEERDRLHDIKREEAVNNKYRHKMRRAMAHRDLLVLRSAVREFEAQNVPEKDKDLSAALDKMEYLEIYNDLTDAMMARDLADLEVVLEHAEAAGLEGKLGLKIQYGYKIRDQLRRLERIRKEVLAVDTNYINDIRALSNPPATIQSVMKATLIILGEPEKTLKAWANTQKLMNPSNKAIITRRIADFDVATLTMDTALRAKHYLKNITFNDVRISNKVCGLFYMWTRGMIDEADSRNPQKKLDAWGIRFERRESNQKEKEKTKKKKNDSYSW